MPCCSAVFDLASNLHVLGEMVRLCERAHANFALEANFAVVGALVNLQAVFAGKRTCALITSERFLARMDARMS